MLFSLLVNIKLLTKLTPQKKKSCLCHHCNALMKQDWFASELLSRCDIKSPLPKNPFNLKSSTFSISPSATITFPICSNMTSIKVPFHKVCRKNHRTRGKDTLKYIWPKYTSQTWRKITGISESLNSFFPFASLQKLSFALLLQFTESQIFQKAGQWLPKLASGHICMKTFQDGLPP